MNKFLFYLLLSLLLNQYLSNDTEPAEEAECTGIDEEGCKAQIPKDTSYKCIFSKEEETSTEAICHKVPKTCEDFTSGASQSLCEPLSTENEKCFADGDACKLKTFCNKASKTEEHECSYYALENEENICLLKSGSETECQETEDLCKEKEQTNCKMIFENNIFVECVWNEESEPGICQMKAKYQTCSSANSLSAATNAECSKLYHDTGKYCINGVNGCLEVASCAEATVSTISDEACESIGVLVYQKCKKGTNGCEIETKLCSDTTIENKEENCQYLKTSSTDNKCYYDGENCSEANSCTSIQETKLSDDKKMQSLCSLFDSETQDCVPDGKKCKL